MASIFKKKTPREKIKSLFKIDVSNISNIKVYNVREDTNSNGSSFKVHVIRLDPHELGMFQLMEIRQFNDDFSDFNISFTSILPKVMPDFVKFINEIVKIYGPDTSGAVGITLDDIRDIDSGKWWTGRFWDNCSVNMNNGTLTMTLWQDVFESCNLEWGNLIK